MSSMKFRYRPLSKDDREIRILRLKPGLPSDPLEAEFRYVSLREFEADAVPFWTALSYCWRAGPSRQEVVVLENCQFPVTANLHSALQHLRHTEKNIPLWVDQIDINQEDLDERSSQVLIMRFIYQRARYVRAWLGDYDKSLETLIRAIEIVRATTHINESVELPDGSAVVPSEDAWPASKVLQLCALIGGDSIDINSIETTLDQVLMLFARASENAWFHRIWIVQELAVGDMLILHAGFYSTSWEFFSFAFEGVLRCRKHGPATETSIAYETLHPLDMTRGAYQSKLNPTCNAVDAAHADEHLRPSTLISAHQKRGAEDPRDHIYALIGITQDGSQDDATLVDYTLPVDLIYQNFAIRCFEGDRSLQALWDCCAGKKRELAYKLPSWTRDWSESISTYSWRCSAF